MSLESEIRPQQPEAKSKALELCYNFDFGVEHKGAQL